MEVSENALALAEELAQQLRPLSRTDRLAVIAILADASRAPRNLVSRARTITHCCVTEA